MNRKHGIYNKYAASSLQAARNILVHSYALNLIDVEFVVLYEENYSSKLTPTGILINLTQKIGTDSQCRTELKFAKKDLFDVQHALRISDNVTVPAQGTKRSGFEAICIFLKRLAFPCRHTDMVGTFGCSKQEICLTSMLFKTTSSYRMVIAYNHGTSHFCNLTNFNNMPKLYMIEERPWKTVWLYGWNCSAHIKATRKPVHCIQWSQKGACS